MIPGSADWPETRLQWQAQRAGGSLAPLGSTRRFSHVQPAAAAARCSGLLLQHAARPVCTRTRRWLLPLSGRATVEFVQHSYCYCYHHLNTTIATAIMFMREPILTWRHCYLHVSINLEIFTRGSTILHIWEYIKFVLEELKISSKNV